MYMVVMIHVDVEAGLFLRKLSHEVVHGVRLALDEVPLRSVFGQSITHHMSGELGKLRTCHLPAQWSEKPPCFQA